MILFASTFNCWIMRLIILAGSFLHLFFSMFDVDAVNSIDFFLGKLFMQT